MQSQLPNLNTKDVTDLARRLNDSLTRIYTDLSTVLTPIAVSSCSATGNTDGEFADLSFSATPTQAECNALRDKCEELADDVRSIHTTLNELIASLSARGIV